MLTKDEFKGLILHDAGTMRKSYPMLRKGQSIFNTVDPEISRHVQFVKGIDCFYDDSKIDEFLDACYDCYRNPEVLKDSNTGPQH